MIRSLSCASLLALSALSALSLAGCATFNPTDQRAETVNQNAADYANNAILLNIARSKNNEPLTFISITGLDGTLSVTGSAGFAGFNIGPHLHSAPRSFLLGPDTVSTTGSDTFHVSVVDDPASFQALLAPVNPALLAFLINQGYPRELLFFLLVDRLQEVNIDDSNTMAVTKVNWSVSNSPRSLFGKSDQEKLTADFFVFTAAMSTLLLNGLTAEVDVSAVPTTHSFPPSHLCIDANLPPPSFSTKSAGDVATTQASAAGSSPAGAPPQANPRDVSTVILVPANFCDAVPWLSGTQSSTATAGSSADTSKTATPSYFAAADGTLWAPSADNKKLVHYDRNGKILGNISVPIPDKKSDSKPAIGYLVSYGDKHYRMTLRSVYGVYDFVGQLLQAGTDVDNLLAPDRSGKGQIIHLGTSPRCFAQVKYRGEKYCVPEDADHTKRLFALLHQLQELAAAPSNTPTTLTVTSIH